MHVVPGGTQLADLTPVLVARFQSQGRAAFLGLAGLSSRSPATSTSS
jgi:hypothetical protein